MDTPRRLPEELAEDLVAGRLAERDAEAVSRALSADGELGRELGGALLIHGLLAGRQADPEKALAAIRRRLDAQGRGRPRARRWVPWAVAIAASLLVAVAGSILLPPRRTALPAGARVVSGSPEGLEPGAATVPLGRAITAGKAPVALACDDKSHVKMAPGSSLTIHGKTGGDRWRIELAAGAVQCDVPAGQRPFRVCTRAGDVVTEGTRFTVRLAVDDAGRRGLAVSVAEGRVRVERPPLGSASVAAGGLRLFPPPSPSGEGASLALRLLFPGEAVRPASVKLQAGTIEIEGKIGELDVEANVAPDGSVQSYSRELPPGELPGVLPAPVRDAVRARFGPDAQWVEADVELRGGVTAYEVTLRVQGKEVEVGLDADGHFLRREDND
ncbi:MAG TPA: FecR domain-containing protein [Planctomycetota bacterium]|nr:FecR domain-containing protein [Planctomycetota bacterium]